MNRCVPMTLCSLMLMLGLSPTAGAVAQPLPQDAVRTAGGAPAPQKRPPLFQVRYVLVKAAPLPQDELPLDFGNGESAIRPLSLSGWPGVQLQGGAQKPNTIVCYGWSCMDSMHR